MGIREHTTYTVHCDICEAAIHVDGWKVTREEPWWHGRNQ